MYMHTCFVFACFTVVKFKGKFYFRSYEQFNDDLCGRKLTSSLKDIQGCCCCFFLVFFIYLFVCLGGVIRSSKKEKNFVLLCPVFLNITCLWHMSWSIQVFEY